MPYGENGTRNGRHRQRRKRSRRKACGKPRILHADFNREGFCFGRRELEHFAETKATAVTEQVVKNHHGKHDSTRGENLRCIVRNDSRNNHRNSNHGNERQNFNRPRCPFAKELVDNKS